MFSSYRPGPKLASIPRCTSRRTITKTCGKYRVYMGLMRRRGKFRGLLWSADDLCRRIAPIGNYCHPLICFRSITFLAGCGDACSVSYADMHRSDDWRGDVGDGTAAVDGESRPNHAARHVKKRTRPMRRGLVTIRRAGPSSIRTSYDTGPMLWDRNVRHPRARWWCWPPAPRTNHRPSGTTWRCGNRPV